MAAANEPDAAERLDHLIATARALASAGEAARADGLDRHRAVLETAAGELRHVLDLMTATKRSDLNPFAVARAMDRFAASGAMRRQIGLAPHIPTLRFTRDPKWKMAA